MKSVKFLCIVIAMLCVVPCFGKGIKFHGKWKSKHKSVDMDLPITGFIEESNKTLQISFHKNLGLVYLTVFDDNGNIVHQESVLTTVISVISISLDGLCDNGTVLVSDGMNSIYSDF